MQARHQVRIDVLPVAKRVGPTGPLNGEAKLAIERHRRQVVGIHRKLEPLQVEPAIRKLDRNITIMLTEHDMDVAFQVADRITVFHQGCFFTEGTPVEVRNNLRVQEIYFGAEEKPC